MEPPGFRGMRFTCPLKRLSICCTPFALSATFIRSEYNAEMIKEGKFACSNGAAWVQGDAFHLPFEETFDLLYTFRFVRHFHQIGVQRRDDKGGEVRLLQWSRLGSGGCVSPAL